MIPHVVNIINFRKRKYATNAAFNKFAYVIFFNEINLNKFIFKMVLIMVFVFRKIQDYDVFFLEYLIKTTFNLK